VIYISHIDLDFLTYGQKLSREPLPRLTAPAMEAVPYTFVGMGIFMTGLHWIIRRRMKAGEGDGGASHSVTKAGNLKEAAMTTRVRNVKLGLWGITGLGGAVAIMRLFFGLGATTNLSDGTPWGLWIGFDVMGGVALAAGGFVITATVYIFRREEFHPIVRPAVLTAFLGYIAVIIGLLFDLGLPWNIWRPMVKRLNPRAQIRSDDGLHSTGGIWAGGNVRCDGAEPRNRRDAGASRPRW